MMDLKYRTENIHTKKRSLILDNVTRKVRIITALLGIGLVLSACCTKPRVAVPAGFPDWQPELGQPIRQLEEILSKLEQQQPMNYTIANIGFLYDAKLYVLFQKLLQGTPSELRAATVEEQHQWLASRKKLTAASSAGYTGGSLGPYAAGRTFIEATKQRIAEIELKLKTIKANPGP